MLPAFVVTLVFNVYCIFGKHQGLKWINHYGKLFGFFFTDRFFYRTRMWSVRDAAWMQSNLSLNHTFTAHEIAIYIIQYFIAIHIAVVIRCWYGLGMVIVFTRNERADHKIVPLKSLVYWRWLMHTTCNGFEIMDRESPWVMEAIPTNKIERVRSIYVWIN